MTATAQANLRDRLVTIRDTEPLERAKLLSFATFRAALPTQELKDAFDAHSLTSTFVDSATAGQVDVPAIRAAMVNAATDPWPFPKGL